jgi:hypothetical protein
VLGQVEVPALVGAGAIVADDPGAAVRRFGGQVAQGFEQAFLIEGHSRSFGRLGLGRLGRTRCGLFARTGETEDQGERCAADEDRGLGHWTRQSIRGARPTPGVPERGLHMAFNSR